MPVGSLGGGVVAFLLALALMFHCYLKHNQTAHRYLSADTSINLLNFDRGHSKMLEEPPTGNITYFMYQNLTGPKINW